MTREHFMQKVIEGQYIVYTRRGDTTQQFGYVAMMQKHYVCLRETGDDVLNVHLPIWAPRYSEITSVRVLTKAQYECLKQLQQTDDL